AREAKPARPLVERYAALPFQRFGNGPLVVLAEEHDRGLENRRPDKALFTSALAGGAVAEVDNGRLAVLADQPVTLDAHCVTGGVQGLGADNDGVEVKVVVCGIPAAVTDAAEERQELSRVQAPAPRHTVLAVGGGGHVTRGQRPARADLRRLLAEQGGPDTELALPLQ